MKKFTMLSIVVGVLALIKSSLFAADDSFRCGSNLISLGDTMYEVRNSCGDPYSEQVIGERTFYKILAKKRLKVESTVLLTEWIYERDDGIYALTFEGSRLLEKEFIFQ